MVDVVMIAFAGVRLKHRFAGCIQMGHGKPWEPKRPGYGTTNCGISYTVEWHGLALNHPQNYHFYWWDSIPNKLGSLSDIGLSQLSIRIESQSFGVSV